MFCGGGDCVGTPEDIYRFYCKKGFTKGLISTGDLTYENYDLDLVTAANVYQCPADPSGCGFKAVFGWTISSKDTMKELVNPANAHAADGLIYGGYEDWDPKKHAGFVKKFTEAVGLYPDAQLSVASNDLLFKNRPLAAIKRCDGQFLAGSTNLDSSSYSRDKAYQLCLDSDECSGISNYRYIGHPQRPSNSWTLRVGTECLPVEEPYTISYLIGKRCPNKSLRGYTSCGLGRKKVSRCVAYQHCLDCDECSGITRVGQCALCWTLRNGTTCINSSDTGTTSIQLRGFVEGKKAGKSVTVTPGKGVTITSGRSVTVTSDKSVTATSGKSVTITSGKSVNITPSRVAFVTLVVFHWLLH